MLPSDGPLSLPDVVSLRGPVLHHRDRPHVVLKYAQTLDGRIATTSGDSKWISGEAERRLTHGLRAACDGVMVGIGTVLVDDPRLTVRMIPGPTPMRVVLDSALRMPGDAAMLADDAGPVVVLSRADAAADRRRCLEARGATVIGCPTGPDGLDPAAVLTILADRGIAALLVEGGARVLTSLLAAGLVDRLIVAIAPRMIGSGVEAVGPLGVSRVTDGLALLNPQVHLVGGDIVAAFDVPGPESPHATTSPAFGGSVAPE